MPFQTGAAMVGGNLDDEIQQKINKILSLLDKEIREQSRTKGIKPKFVKLLHPLNYAVIATTNEIHIVATNQNVGGMPNIQFIDLQDKPLNLQTAIYLAERDLMYINPFGFSFPKQFLELSEPEKEQKAKEITEKYLEDEILTIEKLNRMVRINPIFQGRDFMINDKLVFMLSPFSEPYNTIYDDHIKPTVEKIDSLKCFRADNIYDNKPIIEDIWKSINEASIIISELTGRNPNVFYETGIAHTVGKEVILITQNIDDVPFDLRHLRCIVYEYTPRGIELLETNLSNTIESIRKRINK
ncbi:hypothetical protein FEZ18_12315 [Oceanihabitans sp. IOP_32]|uniref:hypothetical protein n=1 Tax=Oceanihabitans sp. IOP_32 TaxID=2529032 RepID=UPI001293E8ED|nr:hypothetical protein [Oceanihabitans sp. IOP_32]QFZ55528.1 hypothetical protein FEZ18_12315 [Oceanihabitans sp. IOP_32]